MVVDGPFSELRDQTKETTEEGPYSLLGQQRFVMLIRTTSYPQVLEEVLDGRRLLV